MTPKSDLPYLEWTDDAGATQRLYADTIEGETLSLAATATDYPVETGARPTDNVRPEPRAQTLRMRFSMTPVRGDLAPSKGENGEVELEIPDPPGRSLLTPGGLTGAATDAVSGLFGGTQGKPKTATVLRFGEPFDIYRYVANVFDDIIQRSALVTISGALAVLENMAIVSADLSYQPDEGECVMVDLSVKQLTFVSSDVTVAVPLATEVRAQKAKDAGARGKETDPTKQASVAKAASNSAGITSAGSGL